ncbi:Condensin subunit Smc [Mycobacterium tuberculosis]|nr:Condensin subunit Smc [Mycobacterium tuberculosis]
MPVEGAEVSQLRGDKGDESNESAAKEPSTELPETTLPESCAAELRELGIRPATEIIEPLSEDAAALAGIDEHALARVTAALSERLAGVLFAPDAASAEQALHLLAENTLAGQRTIWRIFDPAGTEHTRYSLLYPAEGASPLELAAAYRAASQVVTRTRAELDEAEQAVQQAQTAAESAVEAEREAAKAAGVASAEHARARAQAESLEASAQNIQNERARLNERLTAAEESVAEARTAYESARTREDSYLAGTGEQAPAATIERRAQRLGEVLAEQVSEREQQLHELSTALKNAQEGLTSTNDEVQDLQAAHAAALTLLARTQTEAARVQERVQALAERARLVTGLTLGQLEEEYSEQLPVDVPAEETSENAASENAASENTASENTATEASTESVRARLKATRAELEALGAINPLALEEYEALSERHAYLNQQIEDLKATRRDLNTVMDEVSSHIAEVFTAALEDINTHYRRIFETLFPGGEGHLELDDPSDPLNSGVEIHARPAGKKVKRLSLLSGGERSLASLALLIAIYMSRPSPFYALDEVEAALDDRNLSRLLQVIGELGERSQLIVITHQKRTMQIAETLYGVSMRGGVSTVLSQQMEELRELL